MIVRNNSSLFDNLRQMGYQFLIKYDNNLIYAYRSKSDLKNHQRALLVTAYVHDFNHGEVIWLTCPDESYMQILEPLVHTWLNSDEAEECGKVADDTDSVYSLGLCWIFHNFCRDGYRWIRKERNGKVFAYKNDEDPYSADWPIMAKRVEVPAEYLAELPNNCAVYIGDFFTDWYNHKIEYEAKKLREDKNNG